MTEGWERGAAGGNKTHLPPNTTLLQFFRQHRLKN